MSELSVSCRRGVGSWSCDVTVGSDVRATHHEVTVEDATLRALGVGADAPDRLVEASFRFLLEREPRESILRAFELSVIGRYFPEWRDAMLAGSAE